MNCTKLRHPQPSPCAPAGRFILCVDLEPADANCDAATREAWTEAGRQLAQLLGRHRLPATWAFAEPAHSPLLEQLRGLPAGQEVALLGEASWVGRDASRGCFAGELARRTQQAEVAGLEVTSLVPREVLVDDHLDLVIKHGITAVRGVVDTQGRSRRPAVPHPLHYGLWEIPGSQQLPHGAGSLAAWRANWRLLRRIDRSAQQAGFFQVIIDVPRLTRAGSAGLWSVRRAIRHVAKLAGQGSLEVQTLRDVAAGLSAVPDRSPQQSILRRAG